MDLWEIRAEIDAGSAEQTELALLEHGEAEWTLVEDVIVKRAWVVGIFEAEEHAISRWRALLPSLPSKPRSEPVPERIPESSWKDSYKAHFKAWTFGRLHWVPVWEKPTFVLPAGHSVLWLDPGLAFGTGNHETTRLVINRLVEFDSTLDARDGLRVVDAGCGSGILSLSAYVLGFRDVSGFDIDPEAVRVSIDNAALNGVPGGVRFSVAGLHEGLADRAADILMANIQSDVLIRHCRAVAAAVAPGGLLIMSGILSAEVWAVRDAFDALAPGWAFDTTSLGEWSDVCLRRPD